MVDLDLPRELYTSIQINHTEPIRVSQKLFEAFLRPCDTARM